MIKNISPAFKDDTDKLITLAMLVCTIFFFFIPSLIVVFLPKNLIGECTHSVAKAFFNFEILLFLVSLIFLVPILGQLLGFILGPVLVILNVVFVVINICALAGNKDFKVPVLFEFI